MKAKSLVGVKGRHLVSMLEDLPWPYSDTVRSGAFFPMWTGIPFSPSGKSRL